jgi:copper chaperone CopZ
MIRLEVFGMCCAGCEAAVARAVVSRDPQAQVFTSAADGRVEREAILSAEDAIEASEAAGYEARQAAG